MLHLPADRLAELVDIEPTPQELAHLQSCVECVRERNAFLALRELAIAEGRRASAPLVQWAAIREGLAGGGMISPQPEPAAVRSIPRPRRWLNASRLTLQIAASFALVATGVALGRFSERAGIAAAPRTAQNANVSEGVAAAPDAVPAGESFASSAEAMDALMRAQQDYQRATAFLVASDTSIGPDTPNLYKERLAALDQLMGVTRSALSRAPHDPVINDYYLATLSARETTLQQLQLALPEGTRIDRF